MRDQPGRLDFHFDIHASIVFQLGESLITDVEQALVELIKNAYDADASYANVRVDTEAGPGPGSAFPGALGCITIEDDGEGMDRETIQRGWLTISNSLKRGVKRRGEVTERRHRTPLGDKGLGRLGAQRLGYNLEVFTRKQDSPVEYHVALSWREFLGNSNLLDVPVRATELEPSRPQGTRIVISDLREAQAWVSSKTDKGLQASLAQLISPYQEVRDFSVAVTVNGRPIELVELTKQVRTATEVRYRLDFDGNRLIVRGKARLAFFRPSNPEDRAEFQRLVEKDSGAAFLDFLLRQKQAVDLKLLRSEEPGWFVEFAFATELTDLTPLAQVDALPATPGPFRAEIDSFDLGTVEPGVFDRASDFRKHISSLSGIRVYRDGFGVRVDQDWLKLGQQWTKSGSYYGLKPGNTLGYVALSARENAQLEETTDREGFKKTPHYENFYALMRRWLDFTGRAQGFLRRGWLEFRGKEREKAAGVPADTSSEGLLHTIADQIQRADASRATLGGARRQLAETIRVARQVAGGATARNEVLGPTEGCPSAVTQLEQAHLTLTEAADALDELAAQRAMVQVLLDREASQREQLLRMYEAISLGLTAEALSHEIGNVLDQLAYRSQQLRTHLTQPGPADKRVLAYVEYVRASVAALRRQLAHLAPSLRYVRERRERILLRAALEECADYYRHRWQDSGLEMIVATADDEFAIRMNRGKWVQVLDNLVLNSEYWLRQDLRLGRIAQGCVTIEARLPLVRLYDNGRGVDPSVETSLFEPFVTTKGEGQGRGLGLFITQQLLDTEGCTIQLLPERNADGCRYIFQLDLTGALDGA